MNGLDTLFAALLLGHMATTPILGHNQPASSVQPQSVQTQHQNQTHNSYWIYHEDKPDTTSTKCKVK